MMIQFFFRLDDEQHMMTATSMYTVSRAYEAFMVGGLNPDDMHVVVSGEQMTVDEAAARFPANVEEVEARSGIESAQ